MTGVSIFITFIRKMKTLQIWKIFSILLFVICIKAQVEESKISYASLKDMETFIKTLSAVEENLTSYIDRQNKRIEELKRYVNKLREQNITSTVNSILNPVSAFVVIKHLSIHWLKVQNILDDISEESQVLRLMQDFKFPTREDLQGASNAIVRLQDAYKLKTSDVANGVLNGVNYFMKLTTNDCFELGYQSYANKELHFCSLWMIEAYLKYDSERDKDMDKNDIINYIRECSKDANLLKSLNGVNKEAPEVWRERAENTRHRFQNTGYLSLCRGENLITLNHTSTLRCKLITHISPWMKIAPARIELISRKPTLIIFHDVLFDSEIKHFMRAATNLKTLNTQFNKVTNKTEIAKFRIGKGVWLPSTYDKIADKVSNRVKHLTGLSLETAEALHVFNYGMAGHYSPHFDYFLPTDTSRLKPGGQRVATMLFYMNDVEQGGATVFPHVNVGVWPKKGTAVFWYNILPNGQPDNRTYHGACPVLVGAKWIVTKWFREKGQPIRPPKLI